MRNPLLSIFALAVVASAAVPNKFSSGKPVIAQDVNDNFTHLDSTIAKKADASVKTDLDATKSDLKTLQAKQRADSSTLAASAANGLSMATVNTNLAGLRDTVGKKKDSAWIMKAVTPTAIGAVPGGAGKTNSIPRWTGSATQDASAITDNGTTISLGRPASLNGLVATTLSETPLWNSLYGAAAGKIPAKTNYAFSTREDNFETALNSSSQTILQVGMKNILTATAAGVKINAGTVTLAPSTDSTPSLNLPNQTGVKASYQTGDVNSDGQGLMAHGLGFRSIRGASKDVEMGSHLSLYDVYPKTKSAWSINLGVENTLDFWNYDAANGAWKGKPLIQFLPTGTIKTASLDVGGDIKVAGSLKTAPGSVKASDVADYVFEPSYKLSSLSEVEAFTKQHKHLPEVPSATEIEQGGLDLAKMNLVLLKKVEELTLHAIEQQKAIDQQRQEMAQVKAELKSLKRD